MSTQRRLFQSLAFNVLLIYQVNCSLIRYIFHQDLQVVGCQTKIDMGVNHLVCARKCLDAKKCPSFVYIPETAFCEICTDGYTVTGLTFLPGSGTYFLRNVQDFNIMLDYVEKQYNFPGDFLPGEMLYLRAVPQGLIDWRFDVYPLHIYWRFNVYQSPSTIVFHYIRRTGLVSSLEFNMVNTMVNSFWCCQTHIPNLQYANNEPFELHVLFQSSKVYFYFNKQHLLTYDNEGNAVMETARYLGLTGELYVEEISI